MNRGISTWLTRIISISLLVMTVSSSAATASAAERQPATSPASTIRLAILAPLTGNMQSLGRPAHDGALLAINQQNASGGILGMTIAPVVEDTACDATMAVNATHKVINQDGVHYIIGDVCNGSSVAMSEITNGAGVIQMSPSATDPRLTIGTGGQVKPYIFRTCFVDRFQGAVAARFARNTFSAQRAFIMYPDYLKVLADAFQAEYSKSATIVGKELYDLGQTDFTPLLTKMKETKPDIAYLPGFIFPTYLVLRQAKDQGITSPFVGSDGWDSPDWDKTGGDGGYFINHFSFEDPRPEVSAFDRAFRSQYGYAPDAKAALAYDAAKLLFQAMREAGTADTAAVKTKLEGISYQGVTGTLYYDADHNPIKSAVVMRVQNNSVHFYALVTPQALTINYSNGSPGSHFTLTGSGFPPNRTGTIAINGHDIPETLTIDATGGFVFRLNTIGADEGRYIVTVSVNPSATVRFTLAADASLRPVEGSGPVFVVPEGIAYDEFIYLPFVRR